MRVLVGLLIIGIILNSGCVTNTPTPKTTPEENVLKGVSLSPRSFQSVDFTDFLNKTRQTGNIVSWAGDWNELSNTENSGPVVVASLATSSSHQYIPVIEAQFFTQSNGTLLRPLNNTTIQSYKNSAVTFAETYTPWYLAFGIEVNVLYEKSPQDFETFVQLYQEVYTAIKIVSPATKIFPIFQLEKMKGLNGGLYGGINDPTNSQWSLLEKFPDADLIAFTTYPGLIYNDPSEIPTEYYTEITSHTNKSIAFTEIGWHSNTSPLGWESSEAEQAAFLTTFFNLTKELNAEFVIYSFLFDQDTIEPFNSMGLIDQDGNKKLAWDTWLQTE
jgi:hypothetical protein